MRWCPHRAVPILRGLGSDRCATGHGPIACPLRENRDLRLHPFGVRSMTLWAEKERGDANHR